MTAPSRRAVLGLAAAAALAAATPLTAHAAPLTSDAAALADVPQAGPDPVPLTSGTGGDADLAVLMGTAAARTDGITAYSNGDIAKNWYVQNFTAPSARLSWNVSAPSAGGFRVTALINATAGQQFAVTVRATGAFVTLTAPGGWQRVDAGVLSLPAGASTLDLTRLGTTGDVQVKSLELIRDTDHTARQQRITAARAAGDTTWLQNAGYGLMFQYGAWGFPGNAGTAKTLEQQAADFNVPRFVKTVKETGAAYVIWSFSWWGYRVDAPNTALDTVMGHGDFTAQRDLIGEVAAALQAEGIRFALYYHEGKEEAAWWQKQNFPSTFKTSGTGDRGTFLANWTAVVSEIGERLGTDLDGFFFDDGIVYYPAPFEAMEQAARTGNPARTVCWNSFVMPRLTDFQDVWMGENHTGAALAGSGQDGYFTSGPYQGLLEHGMFTMENDWGVHLQNQAITTSVTSKQAIDRVKAASARKVALSFNLMMYEDGTMAEASLAVLNHLRQAVRGTAPSVPTGTTLVPDNGAGVVYGPGWSRAVDRGAGDLNDDVSYTTVNGSYVEYTFTGTGMDIIGPRAVGGGTAEVKLDGQVVGTFDEAATSYQPQRVVYSARHLAPGTHTVRLTKTSGTYWQIDAFRVVANPVTHNDNAAAIAYAGTWTHAANRGAGDYGDDVTWTSANGATATIAFTGTGLTVRGPMSGSDGSASVKIDGIPAGTVKAAYSGTYKPQQAYWTVDHLTPGSHTVTVTKTGGTYLQIDSVTVVP